MVGGQRAESIGVARRTLHHRLDRLRDDDGVDLDAAAVVLLREPQHQRQERIERAHRASWNHDNAETPHDQRLVLRARYFSMQFPYLTSAKGTPFAIIS